MNTSTRAHLHVVGGTDSPGVCPNAEQTPFVMKGNQTLREHVIAVIAEKEYAMVTEPLKSFLDALITRVRSWIEEAASTGASPSEREDARTAARAHKTLLVSIQHYLNTSHRNILEEFPTHVQEEIRRAQALSITDERSWHLQEGDTREQGRMWKNELAVNRGFADLVQTLWELSKGLPQYILEQVPERAIAAWQLTLSTSSLPDSAKKWLCKQFREHFSLVVQNLFQESILDIKKIGYRPAVETPAPGPSDLYAPKIEVDPALQNEWAALLGSTSGGSTAQHTFGPSENALTSPAYTHHTEGIPSGGVLQAHTWVSMDAPMGHVKSGPVIPHWQRTMGLGVPAGGAPAGGMLPSMMWTLSHYGNSGGNFPLMPHAPVAFAPIGTPMPPQYFHAVLAQQSMPWQAVMPQIAGAHAVMDALAQAVSGDIPEGVTQSFWYLQMAAAQKFVSGHMNVELLKELVKFNRNIELMTKAWVGPQEIERYVRTVMPESTEVTIAAETKGPTAEEVAAIIAEERRRAELEEREKRAELERIIEQQRRADLEIERRTEDHLKDIAKIHALRISIHTANEAIRKAVGNTITLPTGIDATDIEGWFLYPVRRDYHENNNQPSKEGARILVLLRDVLEWDHARKAISNATQRERRTEALLTQLREHLTSTRLESKRKVVIHQVFKKLWEKIENGKPIMKAETVVVPAIPFSLKPLSAPVQKTTTTEQKTTVLKNEISAKSEEELMSLIMRFGEMLAGNIGPNEKALYHWIKSYHPWRAAMFRDMTDASHFTVQYPELVNHLLTGKLKGCSETFPDMIKALREIKGIETKYPRREVRT